MKKDLFVGGFVVGIVLVAIVSYVLLKPAPAQAPVDQNTHGVLSGSYIENAQYYDIVAHYATSTPLSKISASIDASATALMKSFVDDTVAEFKKNGNFANLTAKDVKMIGLDQGRKEKLQIVYLISSSPKTVSYIFSIYEDTLGAHGNIFFRTFTFDTSTGANLSLSDIFTPGSPYLDTLSTISRAELPGVIGDGFDMTFIKDGTKPVNDSFMSFFFDNRELVLLFPPYQVAPYSSGPQTLRIPISLISSILRSEYR
jgi:hypothetical protein